MSKESKFALFVALMLALTVMSDAHADTTPPVFNPGASSYYHDVAEDNVHYARLTLVFNEEMDVVGEFKMNIKCTSLLANGLFLFLLSVSNKSVS